MHESRPDPSGPNESDIVARIERYLEDGLSSAELADLERELTESAANRETFLLVCLGETLAREEFGSVDMLSLALEEAPSGGEDEKSEAVHHAMHETMIQPAVHSEPAWDAEAIPGPKWAEQRKVVSQRRRYVSGGIAAALLISTVIGAFQLLKREPAERVAAVAQLVDVRWDAGSELKTADPLVKGQSVALAGGYAELHFVDQSRVVIEGPAQITLESASAIRLIRGKVAVRMADGKTGFVVHTPDATVTDLGTEFGVKVEPDSKSTDVHVFKGLVHVASSDAKSDAGSVNVAAGDAARVVGSGTPSVIEGGIEPQMFVRDLTQVKRTLELVDLVSGGDGLSGRRGGVLDQTNGNVGTIKSTDLGGDLRGDEQYHPTSGLSAVDGCFVPGLSGKPIQVDSAGHLFAFPPTPPRGTVKICAGGTLPKIKNGDVIASTLHGTDYSSPGHSFLFMHPSAAITLDLDAIRRLHPNATMQSFHCIVGNPGTGSGKLPSNVFVLVDGQLRFSKMNIVSQAAPVDVNIPLSASDRFLTLASTISGTDIRGHQIIFGDPSFSLIP
ncbi:MAG: FecR domain-containing protein [Tepidisphaeraceae bacterium]